MPETPEEFWERVHGALSTPPLEEWESWPFDGDVRPRRLAPPVGAAFVATSSTSEFHAPHTSQRPAHLGWSAPHSVQR